MDKIEKWKFKFINFEKSIINLNTVIQTENPSELEIAGIIQFFEISFELSWKILKEYLFYLGYEINSPREVIRQASSEKIIQNIEIWFEMLEKRNEFTHTYDNEHLENGLILIKDKYYPNLKSLYNFFKSI